MSAAELRYNVHKFGTLPKPSKFFKKNNNCPHKRMLNKTTVSFNAHYASLLYQSQFTSADTPIKSADFSNLPHISSDKEFSLMGLFQTYRHKVFIIHHYHRLSVYNVDKRIHQ